MRSAAEITEALARRPVAGGALPGAEAAAQGAMRLLQRADTEHGGFGGAPKFPTPTSLDLLLAAGDVLPERKAREALEHVVLTCREMARGGLYDHLGGGFHRYSVDARWCVPHFEKMLYDQGQLLRTYTEAWRRSGASDDDLLWPVRETAAFLRREMQRARRRLLREPGRRQRGRGGPLLRLDARVGRARCSATPPRSSAPPTRSPSAATSSTAPRC